VATTIVPLLFGIDVRGFLHRCAIDRPAMLKALAAIRRLPGRSSTRDCRRRSAERHDRFSRRLTVSSPTSERCWTNAFARIPNVSPGWTKPSSALSTRQNGLTVQPHRGNTGNGIKLYCEKFTASPDQSWGVYPVAKGFYRIATPD